jgi:hypothetical protein
MAVQEGLKVVGEKCKSETGLAANPLSQPMIFK